ncbi:MAG TPA: ABC transporter permease [Dehalococcoidia bacterium]|nr:ABC transporter permease [Dehalococcoidia bacterium]
MKSFRHMWLIAIKDLKLFVTDRMALFFFILFPFLFVALFSFILSDVGSEDERLVLHVVTQEDRGGLSHPIAKAIETEDESELEPGEPIIIWDEDYQEALQAVADDKLNGFLAFPEDFTKGISLGYGTNIEVVADPEATYGRAALNSMAEAIASQVGLQQVVRNAITGLMLEKWFNYPEDVDRIGQEMPGLISVQGGVRLRSSLVEYGVEKVGEVEAEEPSNFVVPGYLVMFVFMAAAFSAETIVRERQNHTLERLLAASVRRESILSGIFAGTAAKGLIQITIFWTVGILVFHMDLGLSPAAVVLLSILMVLMSSAFAIMLATLAKTQRSAGSIALITSLVLAPLGGCWWPLFITPRWMQFIAKITPHGWATTGFNKLLVFNADFSAALPEMLSLVGFAALFGIIAVWRFRTSAV